MLYSILVWSHVAAGSVALATFWLTAALRKGTRLHRRVGGSYLAAMAAVLATTPLLAAAALVRGQFMDGAFLLYLTLITATAVWMARRAIRERAVAATFFGGAFTVVGWLNVAGGAAVLALGLLQRQAILVGMSVIGLAVGGRMVRQARHTPADRGWWLKQHYGAILGCGIATHIAFLNIGLQKLLPPQLAALSPYAGWYAPLLVAVLANLWLDRRYGRGPAGAALKAAVN